MDFSVCASIFEKLSPTDWAAWVQAIGSVLAIVAAVLISSHQGRSEKRREADRAKERVTDVIATTIHLAGGLIKIDSKLNQMCSAGSASNPDLELMAVEIGSINRALEGVPIWELHAFDVVENIVSIQSLSETLKVLVNTVKSINLHGNHWASQIRGQLVVVSPDLHKRMAALVAIEKARKQI